ncbi:MAG: adenosine deaminase, partial [Acinetobacter sp.]|nr:adenosine deaminase [Acinetobacter sp.]
MWTGVSSFNKGMYFKVPDDYEYADTYKFAREINGEKVMRVSSVCWFTNFDIDKRREKLPLSRKYEGNEKYYPKYDN